MSHHVIELFFFVFFFKLTHIRLVVEILTFINSLKSSFLVTVEPENLAEGK